MHPHNRGGLYRNVGVWKRWGDKTFQSTSKSQSWASWFLTKWIVWWCGIESNIKKGMTFLWLSLSAWHSLENHYNRGNNNFKKVLFHIVTWSNHKGIWGWAQTRFGLCSSSAKNLPKITFYRKLKTLARKHATKLVPGWQMKDICHTHLSNKIHFYNRPLDQGLVKG